MLCLRRIEGKERKGGEGKGWDEEEAKVLREKKEEKSLGGACDFFFSSRSFVSREICYSKNKFTSKTFINVILHLNNRSHC